MKKRLIIGLAGLLIMLNAGCDEGQSTTAKSTDQRTTAKSTDQSTSDSAGTVAYTGNFGCADFDADDTILIWNEEKKSGYFGWVPSNGGSDVYVVKAITSLSFKTTFEDIYGADHLGEIETVTLDFNLKLEDDGKTISSRGTLLRENGNEENCTIDLVASY